MRFGYLAIGIALVAKLDKALDYGSRDLQVRILPGVFMTDAELWDALDGLCAYDVGCTDSGIHDEKLRAKCIEELKIGLKPNQMYSDRVARLVRDNILSEESIKQGYGLEDVASFIEWLEERM